MKRFALNCLLIFLCSVVSVQATDYVVGSGDVLKITVYDNDDLTTVVRVSDDGEITVPLIGGVDVQGKSVTSIVDTIEDLYANGYLVNPQVNVFVEEYRSKKVIILGQVDEPGLYELSGNTTILELISKAGGLTKDAGRTALVKRKSDVGNGNKTTIDLRQLVENGDTSLNIPIQDGDSIHISKAGEFYVTGEVSKPDSYKFEEGLSVIKAITMAGGFTDIANPERIKVIRKVNGKEQVLQDIKIDLGVQPDDVIVVPESFF